MSQCLSKEQLRAFLSDSLSAEDSAVAAEHLKSCTKCQDEASREADDSDFRQEFLDPLRRLDSNLTASAIEHLHDATTLPTADDTSSPSMARLRPARLGRYELIKEIGRGGIGEVWEAYDTKLMRSVAIKLMRSDREISRKSLDRLLDEGQKLASLRHEGIVDIYDVGEHEDQVYIVMELLSGGSLANRIETSMPSLRESVSLIIRVARAAHALHTARLIHRDIKPANIVLDIQGNPRLSDFGLAVNVTEFTSEFGRNDGTVPYMPPEQCSGQMELTAASDIYSLGVVLYQLLTGVLPHRGLSKSEIVRMIQLEAPAAPKSFNKQIPEELNRICLKCLEKVPAHRFTSAAELADALETCLSRRNRAAIVLRRSLIAAGVMAAALVGWLMRPQKRPAEEPVPHTAPLSQFSVLVNTVPAGARIVVYPLEDRFGLPDGFRRVEAATRSPSQLSLSPGFYLVVASLGDGRFHEVFRTVPEDPNRTPKGYRHRGYKTVGDSIEWPAIEIPPPQGNESLGQFPGAARFQMGLDNNKELPSHHRRIPPFKLDPAEVTLADYREVMKRVLPPSLEHLNDNPPPVDHPLQGIWWDDAMSFAESAGKRLPTEAEYEFAATNGGASRFPWGNEPPTEWPLDRPGRPVFDQLNAEIPVFGLYSNVPEWTLSAAAAYPPKAASVRIPAIDSEHYIVRGAPHSVFFRQPLATEFPLGPRLREAIHGRANGHCVGLRCARSVHPRLEAGDLELVLSPDSDRTPDSQKTPNNPE